MLPNIGDYGFIMASIGYGFLTLLLLLTYQRQHLRNILILATATSIFWAISEYFRASESQSLSWHLLLDVLKVSLWCWALQQMLTQDRESELIPSDGSELRNLSSPLKIPLQKALLIGLASCILILSSQAMQLLLGHNLAQEFSLAAWLALIIFGLRLVEKIYRNASKQQRWSLKYLCMGIGGLFSYDFFMYSDALLFKQLSPDIWQARGFINVLAVPLIAVSIARNPKWDIDIHVSRQVVLHSMTLIGSGLYLVIMALTAYTIKFYGGQWGSVLQTSFLFGALLLLIILLFSDDIRAKTRVLLSKHFFSYKYDYRNEWFNFNQRLGAKKGEVPERICESIAALVDSPGGLLWTKNKITEASNQTHGFELLCRWQQPGLDSNTAQHLCDLEDFTLDKGWIIDMDDYSAAPDNYPNLKIPSELLAIPKRWLLIPLFHQQAILGWLLLQHSPRQSSLNWEDRDLLKMAAQQGAVHLAQYQADKRLLEARQFEAFNRLSTYVIHDLKNILAQQSLIVTNAQKHKHNPAFVDDVISTIEHSVSRMTKLMEQMRTGCRGEQTAALCLQQLLNETIAHYRHQKPTPRLELSTESKTDITVLADRDQLQTVFSHILKNAQEATDATGRITLEIKYSAGDEQVTITVSDSGCGMSDQFIRERLFSPFDSTKGLTGMGIGVYESRNVIQAMGGDLSVSSTPDQGTCFSVTIPCLCAQQQTTNKFRSTGSTPVSQAVPKTQGINDTMAVNNLFNNDDLTALNRRTP